MGKQWKQWLTLFWGAPKSLQMVTAAMISTDSCSWKKSYDQPREHIKKQRHHSANKGLYSQNYGFSSSQIWMWELDHPVKADCWRIDAFELWCWRILLRVPWTSKRSNQSTLKENSPEYSLEGSMLKLKLQYFDHLMQITNSLEEILMPGKIEAGEVDDIGLDVWMASLTQWTWVWTSYVCWCWTGKPGVLQSMESQRATELNWWCHKWDYCWIPPTPNL